MRAAQRHPGRRLGDLRTPTHPDLSRRGFLGAAFSAGLLLLGLPGRVRGDAAESAGSALPKSVRDQLETSPYVYISPLKSDGAESRCHAELWYAWLDGAVFATVSSQSWKARAVAQGLSRARIWVGDYGRRKGFNSGSEEFRRGPSFEARAEVVRDEATMDRLLGAYDAKYPEEIGSWRDRMRAGFRDGSRVLMRYTPQG